MIIFFERSINMKSGITLDKIYESNVTISFVFEFYDGISIISFGSNFFLTMTFLS